MTSHPLSQIRGFIFDLDGTLVTSNLDFVYLRTQLSCPASIDILQFIAALPDAEQVSANKIVEDYELNDAHNALWIEGAEQLIRVLHHIGLPTAIVTRNSQPATELKLKHHSALFTPILTRHDAPPKPDPSALLTIAQDWQLPPNQLAYVGDYVYDLEAAKNAGMLACLYAPTALPDFAHQADWVFRHFSEFEMAVSACYR